MTIKTTTTITLTTSVDLRWYSIVTKTLWFGVVLFVLEDSAQVLGGVSALVKEVDASGDTVVGGCK